MLGTRQLRLQLLSTAQDELALDLFRFLDPLIPWAQARARVRWWARGWVKSKRGRLDSAAALVGAVSGHPANEIEADLVIPQPHRLAQTELTVVSLRCSIKISPTNTLWAPVTGFVLSEREAEARRATYESHELALKWNEIVAHPTLLDILLEISSDEQADQILRSFWSVLPTELPGSRVWESTFGFGDLLDPAFFRSNVLEALAPWPRGYALLGERLDELHPVMLGTLSLFDQLAELLGDAVLSRRLSCNGREMLSASYLPTKVASDPKSRARVSRLLVPRDSSTAPIELQETKGEFRIAGHVFYTERRRRELQEAGRLPTLPTGFLYFPLVAAKYCVELGIEPEDMLVDLWQEPLIERVQREIDRAFERSPTDAPLIERVWRAHEAVYRKWLYGPDQRLAFLRKRLLGVDADSER